MNPPTSSLRVAAVQATPVFLDLDASVAKAVRWIETAAGQGAEMVVFPEAFLAGYPDWVWLLPGSHKAELDELYAALWRNAVDIPGPHVDVLGTAARRHGVTVALGVNERNAEGSRFSLYNTLLLIDPQGAVRSRHRKLIPTGAERMVWARGDGTTLQVHLAAGARVGSLICWENYMPLARQALYQQGLQVLLAPTWDASDVWQASMRHVAKEGGVYVISCCQVVARAAIPDGYAFKTRYAPDKTWINRGRSCIVDPRGNLMAGPVAEEETILYADLDLMRIPATRWLLDVAGHYARSDVFAFRLRTQAPAALHSEPDSPVPFLDPEDRRETKG